MPPSLEELFQLAKQAKKIIAPDRPALINMVPRALQQDLGRGVQTPEAWIAQLKNRPGVSPKELGDMFASVKGQGPLSSQQLMESAVVPKRYAQRAGVRQKFTYEDSMDEALQELSNDMMWQRNADPRMRAAYDESLADYLGSLSEPNRDAENIARNYAKVRNRPIDHPERQQWRRWAEAHQGELDATAEARGSQYNFDDFVTETDRIPDLATQLAREEIMRDPGAYISPQVLPGKIATEKYSNYQRQIPSEGPAGPYFESVLRVSPRRALETGLPQDPQLFTSSGPYHFSNKGQLGHIRGSIPTDFENGRNIMLVDEGQADPMERPGPASPDLRNVYGQLWNMAIERASAANLGAVAFPTGRSITSVRDPSLADFYERVYDRDLGKNVLDPLHKRGFTINSNQDFNTVELPEEARKAILDPAQRILGYADGGTVPGTFQDRISALEQRAQTPQKLAGGGIVGKAMSAIDEFLRLSVVKAERGGNWLGMTPGGRSDQYFNELKKPYDYAIGPQGISGDMINQATGRRNYAAGGVVRKLVEEATPIVSKIKAKVLSFPAKDAPGVTHPLTTEAPYVAESHLPSQIPDDFLESRLRALLGRSDEGMTLEEWIKALEAKGYAKGGLVTAAHEAATSPRNDHPEPTEAQKSAGNYRKGHVRIAGLEIAIENPQGSRRKPDWPPLKHHYGYIKGTVGKDKDHIDVFVHPDTPAEWRGPIFVVDQTKPGNGHFDEHKVMLGFPSAAQARSAYKANYTPNWKGDRAVTSFPNPAAFKLWLEKGDTKAPAEHHQLHSRIQRLVERAHGSR